MYKECNVVMLPTNEKAHFGDIVYDYINKNLIIFAHQNSTEVSQHLYITSDEQPKKNEWFLFINKHPKSSGRIVLDKCLFINDNSTIQPVDNGFLTAREWKKEYCHKIIATTDNSLNIPLIHESFIETFIEEYNKGNKIKKVLVEYKEIEHLCGTQGFNSIKGDICPACNNKQPSLVLNRNTINIKLIKDSWTRKEVIDLIKRHRKETYNGYSSNKWIEENL